MLDKEKIKTAFKNKYGETIDNPFDSIIPKIVGFIDGAEWAYREAWGEAENYYQKVLKTKCEIDGQQIRIINEFSEEVEKLQAENKKLRECVEFYANNADLFEGYDLCDDYSFFEDNTVDIVPARYEVTPLIYPLLYASK